MIKSGIYMIYNSVNNRYYIGKSVNILCRWSEHKSKLKANKHKNKHLQLAWNKYGSEAFEFQILELVKNKDDLLKREQFWIDNSKCLNKKFGYNINSKAEGCHGKKKSEDHKRKLSLANKGKKHSEETKIKISEILIGNKRNRNKHKWPCEEGSKCECKECRSIKLKYHKDYYRKKIQEIVSC